MAVHGTICKLFPEYGRFTLEEISGGVFQSASVVRHTFLSIAENNRDLAYLCTRNK